MRVLVPRLWLRAWVAVGVCACVATLVLTLVAGVQPATAAARARHTAANWNVPEQRLVLSAGLMSEVPGAGFAGAAPLSVQADGGALGALALREGLPPLAVQASAAPLTVAGFDALFVDQLGLGDIAEHVQAVAAAAGLEPPGDFGSEVLARYLGLRYDHPAHEDALELYPWNSITRAEAAHSFVVALGLDSYALAAARETLAGFALPSYTSAQLRVLRIAVSKIGMPYVWGGTTDGVADGLEHGGYDCSGFAWRVYKLSGLPWGRQIHGRTAAEQAGGIPKRERIPLADVEGGDLLFFGSAGFGATATEANVIHEAIALSQQWAIHSSAQGVYVLPLTSGWLEQSFAWARRVLP